VPLPPIFFLYPSQTRSTNAALASFGLVLFSEKMKADQRKKDYQMSAEFEGASGVTKIQVGRNWSKTVVAGAIGILLVAVLLYVLTRLI
jgi:hypothetical protein